MRKVFAGLFSALLLVIVSALLVTFLPTPIVSAVPSDAPAAQTTPTSAAGTATTHTVGAATTTANLRSGPGTSFARIDGVSPGQQLTIADSQVNSAGELWYQLDNGSWIAGFLVSGVRTIQVSTQPFSTAGMIAATVTNIVDGDTIDVSFGSATFRLRYIGMNTPERGQDFFNESTAANRALVGGKVVYLEKDVSAVDRYDRLLRYVYLADGTMVNYELVRRGYAQVATYPPDVKNEPLFREAQRLAVAEGAGLWATSAQPTATPRAGAAAPSAANSANLRGGPGTNFPVVGSVGTGQTLEIVARNQTGDWLKLGNGAWIYAVLVTAAPAGLPVAQNIPAPAVAPPVTEPVAVPNPVAPAQPAASPANCDPSYPTVCIPTAPPDLDCGEIPYRRFTVSGSDPHRFDGDHDGIGCER